MQEQLCYPPAWRLHDSQMTPKSDFRFRAAPKTPQTPKARPGILLLNPGAVLAVRGGSETIWTVTWLASFGMTAIRAVLN